VQSLIFPLLVLVFAAFHVDKKNHLTSIALPWWILIVAMAQFAFLSEENSGGLPIIHGNWLWQSIIAIKILFIFSIATLLKPDDSKTTPAVTSVLLKNAGILILMLHFLSGLLYTYAILSGARPY